jgi:membrane-associated protease RseP (regulator of RpoE activity)
MPTAPALTDSPLAQPPRLPWRWQAICLLATLVTTTFAGGWHHAGFDAGLGHSPAIALGSVFFWLNGLWFSVPVLAILGAHESGHYVACRRYGVSASLPLFLPAPLPLTGTFGAFIRIRDVIPSTRALFDIGAAGPLAGFAVAVPLLVLGISWSRVTQWPGDVEMIALGRPLLFAVVQDAWWGVLPDGQLLHAHPTARAAWFGLLATALNLFPLAQFDGGHIAYAVMGRHARWITMVAAATIVALTLVSDSWIPWAVIVGGTLAVAGVGHPPTQDDRGPLDRRRLVLAVVAAVVFALCFTAAPVEVVDHAVSDAIVVPIP